VLKAAAVGSASRNSARVASGRAAIRAANLGFLIGQDPPAEFRLLSRRDRAGFTPSPDQPMHPGPTHLVFRGHALSVHTRIPSIQRVP